MTDPRTLTPDQLVSRLRANADERRRLLAEMRRRAEKVKRKSPKVKSQDDKDREREYYKLLANSDRCWACERTRKQVPPWWHADFGLCLAHFANKPRIEDVRVVVVLCWSCHHLNHNQRIGGCDLPPLTNAHLLWLKIENDAPIDWEYIAECGGRGLEPVEIPEAYLRERERNREAQP